MRFDLYKETDIPGNALILFMEFVNELAVEKDAFALLHIIHHLNGSAFLHISDGFFDRSFNSMIFDAFTHYHKANGSGYRLYARTCSTNGGLMDALKPIHIFPTRKGLSAGSTDSAKFIFASGIDVYSWNNPREIYRLREVAAKLGAYCQNLELTFGIYPEDWTKADGHAMVNFIVEVSAFNKSFLESLANIPF